MYRYPKSLSTLLVVLLGFASGCGLQEESFAETIAAADYEVWRDSLPRLDDGRYLIEGDLPYRDGRRLRHHFYSRVAEPTPDTVEQALMVADYSDNVWDSVQKGALSYCITDGFGGQKAKVRTAIDQAARAWESVTDVRFVYDASQDGDCDDDNDNVLFNVRPACVDDDGDGGFGAMAFFPWYDREDRELLVCNYYDNHASKTLAGVMKHELGHLLGFPHEHERPDCDDADYGQEHITTYDPMSVMHYRGKCGSSTDYDYFLTARDIDGARAIYGAVHSYRVALRAGDGHFLTAMNGGGSLLRANADHLGPWETFEVVRVGSKVALRTWGGSRAYLRAVNGGGSTLRFDRWQRNAHELFGLVNLGGGHFAIRAHKGQYLAAIGNGGGNVKAATTGGIGGWNRFEMIRLDDDSLALENKWKDGRYMRFHRDRSTSVSTRRADRYSTLNVVELGDGHVALRTVDGLYLSALNGGGGDVAADRDVVRQWETFGKVVHTDGSMSFTSHDGHYLRATGDLKLRATRTWASSSTRFRPRNLHGAKTVALRAPNGQYAAAQGGGGGELIADANVIDIWEIYGLVDLGDNRVALRAHNGNFLTAENGGGGNLVADRDWIDAWETFTLVGLSGGKVALRTSDGHYIRAVNGGGAVLDAVASAIGPWERFRMPVVF